MSSVEILPLVALLAMFVIASILPVNIGILGFIGAFAVGAMVLGYDDKEILSAFPSSIVLTIIGVTYFFGMANKNGTIDLMVNSCIRAARGRVRIVPWVFFAVASVLTALGTFTPAAVALLSPAAMSFAAKVRMSPLVMGIMLINGAHAGAFSPISVSGVLVRGMVENNGMTVDPWALFFASYGINTLLSILTIVVYALLARTRDLGFSSLGSPGAASGPALRGASSRRGGGSLARRGTGGGPGACPGGVGTASQATATAVLTRPSDLDAFEAEFVEKPSVTWVQKLTLALITVLLVLVLVFQLPVSFVAITAGAVLALTDLKGQKDALAGISWSTVLLVAGMITYISVLEELGTIDHVAHLAITLGTPLLVALVLCYVIGITSAFASSTALLAAIIPLALPLLETGALPVVGVVAALSIAATVVDVSPFSTNGALVLANAQGIDRSVFYRQLIVNAGLVVLIAPAICWTLMVWLPTLVA
ncbi:MULTISPECIES: SLC13 family permease [Citricoccus]|uniref:SLC13 family permease n=1 Tax=Citricoccus TaxID=169133 RepID=UPI0002FDBFF2|nr:SLC13 family permease [Citricoccus sp. CH26A]